MRLLVIYFFITLLFGTQLQAQNHPNEFGFRSDNDAYLGLGQDRYYTNGLFITFRHALPAEKLSDKLAKKTWEIEFGQYLYNSNSGQTRTLSSVDRPYAAYLYGGLKLNWFKKDEQHFQAGLQVGTIGPKAFGREVQESLHKIIGFYSIEGWDYQVNNETGVNASFNYSNLLFRSGKDDFSFTTGLNLGNTFTSLGAGFLYRTGNFNQFFNSISTNSRISNSKTDTLAKKESFFYAKPYLSVIGYNATIQGGLFRDDKGPATFSPNRLFFTQEIGVMYAKNRWSLNFAVFLQTKELSRQKQAQQYGSASVFYRFK